MKRLLVAVFAVFIGLGAFADHAEAKRFGGGKSSGMQRSYSRDAAPQRSVDQTPARQQPAPGAAPRKNSWMGPLAGLAAGLGLAALFSHLGMGEGMANFVMLALLALVAVVVVRWLMNRAKPRAPANPMQTAYANAGQSQQPASFEPAPRAGEPVMRGAASDPVWQPAAQPASAQFGAPASLPPGFDAEGFAREAKRNFIRLQAAYDAADLDDLREFTSPEMFAEVKLQLAERGSAPQTTDVVEVNANVLACVQEGNRYIASVRFTGLIREEKDAPATSFDETWHLSKPTDDRHGWVVAGIQQND
ncbi:membrane protein [Chitiniphilus shinanonensis]|uniref:Membrane protein n=1 Tax=Chitiniphilus shinanonensis TaxID=553088 RepID=A0ABQ6C0T3_9NEIS|nr:transporter [Chitiniphilus shinanonensis]GLS06112.1 membrane protein [Chitiniphilus shinanonensis]